MSRVLQKAARPATIADLLAIPEPERFHELVEGMLVDKEAASGKHGEAQLSLGNLEALVAVRGETVRAEPFEARELAVGVLFGDDEPA